MFDYNIPVDLEQAEDFVVAFLVDSYQCQKVTGPNDPILDSLLDVIRYHTTKERYDQIYTELV